MNARKGFTPKFTTRGFTLLEILVSIAILGILSVGMAFVCQGALRMDDLQRQEQRWMENRANRINAQFAGIELEDPPVKVLDL
ncbi:MAG: prepilin-type N-terminal cleavage/methylation domain-containing protein [Verrucomicrobia bacterium]|nr:prepilin-type N-terminal cleavage/methylation domain-containing protein [Verrucomicrobiota bacterium]MCH8511414.1 prepilin-type N-terminal cleavage/methylation domain-containing protein [Kiritimatiellia bacterium]